MDKQAKNCKTEGNGEVKNSSAKQEMAVWGTKWSCGQLHDVKIQHLIKKIPCLDSWNNMISKAKHRCIKKINFCIQGVEKKTYENLNR